MIPSLANLRTMPAPPRNALQRLDPAAPSDRLTRADCRALAAESARAVVALYANPRMPPALASRGVTPLNALTREMRSIISLLNPFDFFLSPSTTAQDLPNILKRYQPKVLLWSGHTFSGKLLFEDERGLLTMDQMMDAWTLATLLDAAPSVELVCLMACSSLVMVPPLGSATRERVSFIGWESVTADDAALAFTSGIIAELATQLSGGELNVAAVFQTAVQSFLKGGFRFGDPNDPLLATAARPHGTAVFSPAGQADRRAGAEKNRQF